MGTFDIFDTIAAERAGGRAFCVATVVRTAEVTSAKAGAKAVVTADGEILGHLGGACVRRAVREAGLAAIGDGAARVIRVKPSEKVVALRDEDGAEVYRSGCPSGGTVDLLIEPYVLPPVLCIFGDTPISRALAAHAGLMGYRVALPAGTPGEAVLRFDGVGIGTLGLTGRDFVVVASQGAQDLACLRAALESPARRVSMVASRRKAEALCARLRQAGLAEEALARLKSPAGLDIGAVDPAEIALSVLAEIVAWRNADRAAADQAGRDSA